jgi:TRAP-type uncharacterized transport system substrate-binding protein
MQYQMNNGFVMKRCIVGALCVIGLTACAAVFTDSSNSNQVTYLNTDGDSKEQLTQKANAYCAQYGKVAEYKSSDTELVSVFDCKFPQKQ